MRDTGSAWRYRRRPFGDMDQMEAVHDHPRRGHAQDHARAGPRARRRPGGHAGDVRRQLHGGHAGHAAGSCCSPATRRSSTSTTTSSATKIDASDNDPEHMFKIGSQGVVGILAGQRGLIARVRGRLPGHQLPGQDELQDAPGEDVGEGSGEAPGRPVQPAALRPLRRSSTCATTASTSSASATRSTSAPSTSRT